MKNKSNKKVELVKAEGNTAEIASSFLQPANKLDASRFIIKSRSPLIKPGQLPLGQVAVGVLVGFISCEAGKDEKGEPKPGTLIEFRPKGAKVGFCLPAVATLAGALEMKGVGKEATSPYIGHEIAIQRLEEKIPSKRGNSAWNFIVAISEDKA
jgi:hypothetical protein